MRLKFSKGWLSIQVDLRSRYGIFSTKIGLVPDSPDFVTHQGNYQPFSSHHSVGMSPAWSKPSCDWTGVSKCLNDFPVATLPLKIRGRFWVTSASLQRPYFCGTCSWIMVLSVSRSYLIIWVQDTNLCFGHKTQGVFPFCSFLKFFKCMDVQPALISGYRTCLVPEEARTG